MKNRLTKQEFDYLLNQFRTELEETLVEIIFECQYRPCYEVLMSKYGVSYANAHEVTMSILLALREALLTGEVNDYEVLLYFFEKKHWLSQVQKISTELDIENIVVFDNLIGIEARNLGLSLYQFVNMVYFDNQNETKNILEKLYSFLYLACCTLLKNTYSVREPHDIVIDSLLELDRNLLNGTYRYGNLLSFGRTRSWQNLVRYNAQNRQLVFVDILPIVSEEEDIMVAEEDAKIDTKIFEAYKNAFSQLCEYCQTIMGLFYGIKNEYTEQVLEQEQSMSWESIVQIKPTNDCKCNGTRRTSSNNPTNAIRTKAHDIKKKLKKNMAKALNIQEPKFLKNL